MSRQGPSQSRRRKKEDYIGTHEVDLFPRPITKRFRVRTYDSEKEMPVVVISAFEDAFHATTPDIELIAAEVVLREFPERALRARKRKKFVHIVEHLPKNYDYRTCVEDQREQFDVVEFNDWRIRIGGRPWRVRNVERALREHTTNLANNRATYRRSQIWQKRSRKFPSLSGAGDMQQG